MSGRKWTDETWFHFCFQWWKFVAGAGFLVSNERSPVDKSEHIPAKGWVS